MTSRFRTMLIVALLAVAGCSPTTGVGPSFTETRTVTGPIRGVRVADGLVADITVGTDNGGVLTVISNMNIVPLIVTGCRSRCVSACTCCLSPNGARRG